MMLVLLSYLLVVPLGSIVAEIPVAECGKTLGCFQIPSGCATEADCDILVSWKPEGNDVTIQLSAKDAGWVAMALSDDKLMGESDSALGCLNTGGGKVEYITLVGKKSPVQLSPSAPADMMRDVTVSYENNRLSCSITRPLASSSNIADLSSSDYHILLAKGNLGGTSYAYHSMRDASGSKVKLSEAGRAGAAGLDPKIKAHGILMMLAWVTFAGTGLIVARYFKGVLKADDCMQQKVWFTVHRTCMIIVFCCTVAAFVIIFVHVRGFTQYKNLSPKVIQAHPFLGVIVTFLGVLNPLIALCRCHPGEPNRVYFNWIHWAVGTLAHILGVIAIFLGYNLNDQVAPGWLTWVLLAYVIVHAITEIVLEIHKCMVNRSGPSNEMQMKGGENIDISDTAREENHSFKKAVLGLYIFVAWGLGIFMAVIIGLQ